MSLLTQKWRETQQTVSRFESASVAVRKALTSASTYSGARSFGQMAVGHLPSKPAPAAWTVDKNEFVRAYRNSVYIAVGAIARKMAMQEAKVKRVIGRNSKAGPKYENVKFSHPLCELFREVNPRMNEWELWFYTEGWKLLTGDSYWWKARNGFGKPKELWPIPSQWVHVIPSETEFIGGYEVHGVFYSAEEVTLPARDIVQISEPNLDWQSTGRFYGMAPLQACASTVDIEGAMFERLLHSFRNYANPGQIFSTDQKLTDAQLRQIYNVLVNQHSLAAHSGRPMIVHSGLKPMIQTGSVKEMDYSKSLEATLTLTLAVFGVPKSVAGLMIDQNRANAEASLMSFAANCINPRLVQNGQHLTYSLAREFEPDGSLVIYFDPVTVNDMEYLRKAHETCARFGAVDPNEMRDALLDLPEFKRGGNTPIVNAGMQLASYGNSLEPEEPLINTRAVPGAPGMPTNSDDGADADPAMQETEQKLNEELEKFDVALRAIRGQLDEMEVPYRVNGNGFAIH